MLASGQVVGTSGNASMFGASMADVNDIRAADSSFVLDQLMDLARVEPTSPLAGHLDLQHVGMIGHSLGGATAVQVISTDARSRSASTSTARLQTPWPVPDSIGPSCGCSATKSIRITHRLGLAGHVVVTVTNVPLAVIFYDLFKVVNRRLALLDAFFILVATAIEAAGLLHQFAPLVLVGSGASASAPAAQLAGRLVAGASSCLAPMGKDCEDSFHPSASRASCWDCSRSHSASVPGQYRP